MIGARKWKTPGIVGVIAAIGLVSGCSTQTAQHAGKVKANLASNNTTVSKSYAYTPKDKECLERAMFFESNRSSQDGLLAVGTVVMNRLDSGKYANTICGVVGEKGQFAPGVLSRPMQSAALPDVQQAADAVLKGQRHPKVKEAMFFHTAGLRFPYRNMHYTVVAGGNAFYEKRDRYNTPDLGSKVASVAIANAYIASMRNTNPASVNNIMVASAQPTMTTTTSGRVTNQPFAVAQAQTAPAAAPQQLAFANIAVPVDPPAPAMVFTAPASAKPTAMPQAAEPAVLAFEAPKSKSVDAIGQMLLAQDRPAPAN
ncbi:cell wall hydrolase [Phyllobacterium sp. TAF24]|uniref:cell wall hydrolase n=1 Tax=unclassified Phyllobacterium TaxID=2638441 RepID=UPI00087E5F31|nr:cell wall hydrolase [Phyllobacterium sp. OV277]SDO11383.1 Cell wall hydrolase CwlJ, involved in spore germination [Phyllobacterium sp. OV277]